MVTDDPVVIDIAFARPKSLVTLVSMVDVEQLYFQ
jgi:hypothetical protein